VTQSLFDVKSNTQLAVDPPVKADCSDKAPGLEFDDGHPGGVMPDTRCSYWSSLSSWGSRKEYQDPSPHSELDFSLPGLGNRAILTCYVGLGRLAHRTRKQ
jgi:hypothetical protein